jgi:hypothetical protein
VLSIDALLKRRWERDRKPGDRPGDNLELSSFYARWPLLMIQWFYGLFYISAALAKLFSGGLSWVNGYTLQYYLLDAGVQLRKPAALWFGSQHGLITIFSWITVLFEGSFWLVLLFPRLAWIYVPAGIGLHMGIYLIMGPDFFEYLALYVVFIPWARVFHFVREKLARKEFRIEIETS